MLDKRFYFLCCLITSLLAPGFGAAEVFRWTDENGKVHFGDQPPADQQLKHEQITISPPEKIGQDNTRAIMERARRLLDTESELTQQQHQREHAARQKQLKTFCARARKDLKILSGRVRYVNKEGERYDVSEERVAEDRARIQQQVDEHCQDY